MPPTTKQRKHKRKQITGDQVEELIDKIAGGNASAFAWWVGYDRDTIYRLKANGTKQNACFVFMANEMLKDVEFWRGKFEECAKNETEEQ